MSSFFPSCDAWIILLRSIPEKIVLRKKKKQVIQMRLFYLLIYSFFLTQLPEKYSHKEKKTTVRPL